MRNDTIFAPSSAIGGAIAVLRVSGPEAARVAELLDRDITSAPSRVRHARLLDGKTVVDDCMAAFFRAPRSYTGEDMAELYCHGGPMTVQKALALLSGLGFRPAEAGEFTRRAFENGKLDLSQAEAVMDVINASAEKSLKAAVLQLTGSVRSEITALEELLLDALAGIDAAIDYPDEAEADAVASLPETLARVKSRLAALIDEGRRGRVLRDGLRAVILGRPNVGKSSLLNALLGTDRAIVTPLPGTTRDVLDERTAIDGVPVRLVDTAGIRDGADAAESIGVERARRELRTADLILLVLDSSEPLAQADRELLGETAGTPRILILNKSDLPSALTESELPAGPLVRVSAARGDGIGTLKREILRLAAPAAEEAVSITNERHVALLERALAALAEIPSGAELDCVATDVRDALHFLGAITGRTVDAHVIARIFERFCVGK